MTAVPLPADLSTETLTVRVMIPDVWDEIVLTLAPTASLAELKSEALTRARVTRPLDEYHLKFRGFELDDETLSLSEAGLVPNAGVIVLPRRRRPVR